VSSSGLIAGGLCHFGLFVGLVGVVIGFVIWCHFGAAALWFLRGELFEFFIELCSGLGLAVDCGVVGGEHGSGTLGEIRLLEEFSLVVFDACFVVELGKMHGFCLAGRFLENETRFVLVFDLLGGWHVVLEFLLGW
jgi:hypothetical protein